MRKKWVKVNIKFSEIDSDIAWDEYWKLLNFAEKKLRTEDF